MLLKNIACPTIYVGSTSLVWREKSKYMFDSTYINSENAFYRYKYTYLGKEFMIKSESSTFPSRLFFYKSKNQYFVHQKVFRTHSYVMLIKTVINNTFLIIRCLGIINWYGQQNYLNHFSQLIISPFQVCVKQKSFKTWGWSKRKLEKVKKAFSFIFPSCSPVKFLSYLQLQKLMPYYWYLGKLNHHYYHIFVN